jgi:hypothetical protein
MKEIINENDILGFDPKELEKLYESDDQLEHLNDNKFFIDYRGKTMKRILEDRGLGEYWSFVNTDTHEIVEAPDVNWLFNIIFELTEIQRLPKNLIVSLLEEYFIERKKDIINEWRQLAARYLDLYPEEYNKLIK